MCHLRTRAKRTRRLLATLLLAAAAIFSTRASAATERWTATWGSSQLQPSEADTLGAQTLNDATLRQVVHISIGGSRLRLHLSNAFGERPLVLRTVHVGRGRTGSPGFVEIESDRALTFKGKITVSIPAGAEYLSDPAEMTTAPLSDLVVTMMIDSAPDGVTFRSGALHSGDPSRPVE